MVDDVEELGELERQYLFSLKPIHNSEFKSKPIRLMKCTSVSNLKTCMKNEEINIAQLARKIGVTENTIRGYVKNSFSRIDCEVAITLCDYFGTTFGEMFEIVP